MRHSDLVAALVVRYREHLGRLQVCESDRDRLKAELKSIRESIRVFDPSYRVGAIRPLRKQKKNPYFLRGEITRSGMTVLRMAQAPMTAREIAQNIFRQRGIDADAREIKKLSDSLIMGFSRTRSREIIAHDDRAPRRWWIKKP
jgi:hypothetical protein